MLTVVARRCELTRDLNQVAKRVASRKQLHSSPTVAPRRICHYGTRSQRRAPSGWVLPQNSPRYWAAGTAALVITVYLFRPVRTKEKTCMKETEAWDCSISNARQRAIARWNQRIKHQNPWHRALVCCVQAQRVRVRRPWPKQKHANTPLPCKDWNTALQAALERAIARYRQQSSKGSWDYALRIKLTAWNMRYRESLDQRSSAQQNSSDF